MKNLDSEDVVIVDTLTFISPISKEIKSLTISSIVPLANGIRVLDFFE